MVNLNTHFLLIYEAVRCTQCTIPEPGSADKPCAYSELPAWNDRIANAIAPGSSAEHVRGYLKTTAERAWRANWLTHAANANWNDAELALSATSFHYPFRGKPAIR